MATNVGREKLLQGYCPDPFCNERLLIHESKDKVDCFFCGQTFFNDDLKDISPINAIEAERLRNRISRIPKRHRCEWIKIRGFSPFFCKLISSMFTTYGVDEKGKARLLSELTNCEYFDCCLLAEYAFEIEESELKTKGYGMDSSGSCTYLSKTLSLITEMNGGETVLVPLHVGGDGNCLVHAVSRALVGREIFWHPLREQLRRHFTSNEEWYKKTIGEFIADDDFQEIVKECDTSYLPRDDRLGLRTAHIFALANILHKPIILLDIPENIVIGADFSAVFLPVLHTADECKDENGELYKPIVVAWGNKAHNHFVPLVHVKDASIPKMSRSFLPKAWSVGDSKVEEYIKFKDGFCFVSTGSPLHESKIRQLIIAMQTEYTYQLNVSPLVVSDFCEDVLRINKFSLPQMDKNLFQCIRAATGGRLWRCMICWRLSKTPTLDDHLLKPGGLIFEALVRMKGAKLQDRNTYTFDPLGTFTYDSASNSFVPHFLKLRKCRRCSLQKGQLRLQFTDSIKLIEGDHTRNPAPDAMCKRKMKHFYNNSEYDNLPFVGEIEIDVNGKYVQSKFQWFAFESDVQRNSTYESVTSKILQNLNQGKSNSDKLKSFIQSLVIKKVKSFSSSDEPLCKDPCWILDTDDELEANNSEDKSDEKSYSDHKERDDFGRPLQMEGLPKPMQIEPPVYLHVYFSDGTTTFIEWDESFLYTDITSQICCNRSLSVSQLESVWFGNPPVQLKEEFPLPLKPGIELHVNIRTDVNTGGNFKALDEEECAPKTKYLVHSLSLKYEECLGTNKFWLYLEKNPQAFRSNGAIYQLIMDRAGLMNNKHYILPAFLPNKPFVYCSEYDRIELCVRDVGHFEINEKMRKIISDKLKFCKADNSYILKIFDFPAQKLNVPVTKVDVVPSCQKR